MNDTTIIEEKSAAAATLRWAVAERDRQLGAKPATPRHQRIYLASSWRNERQPELVQILREAGHEVYDFRHPAPGNDGFSWRSIDPAWQTWTADQQIAALAHPIAKRSLSLDYQGMRRATVCVMLQPCGRSAALELGWAIGAGKRTAVLMVDGQEPELMLRLADLMTTSVDSLLAWLDELGTDPTGGLVL